MAPPIKFLYIRPCRQVDMFSCGSSIVQYGASLVDGKSVFEMDDSFTYRDKVISRLLDQPLPNLLSNFCSYCGIYWNCKKGSTNVFKCGFCERWMHDICLANEKEEQRKIENDPNFRCFFCQVSSKPCSNK